MAKTKKRVEKKEHFLPHFSILYATCCTNLSIEEATRRMNEVQPTGISSKWQLAEKNFWPECLKENPWPCEANPKYKHMYFIC